MSDPPPVKLNVGFKIDNNSSSGDLTRSNYMNSNFSGLILYRDELAFCYVKLTMEKPVSLAVLISTVYYL